MKKALIGALASLMLAGAISAASGLNTDYSTPADVVLIGDGTSPISVPAAPVPETSDPVSQGK
jgi:hypothetical protein